MNHQLVINESTFIVKQYRQKIVLFSLPHLQVISKYYLHVSFTAVNHLTCQILSVYKNAITILKPSLFPFKLSEEHQSFVEWEPLGGIIMKLYIILYDMHGIHFLRRGSQLEQSWEIDIIQQIESIKSNQDESVIGLKVKAPSNILFLWNLNDLNVKPNQQIILTQDILQWQFFSQEVLSILTPASFFIYFRNSLGTFNLQHFFQFHHFRSFCWLGSFNTTHSSLQSINTVSFITHQGDSIIFQVVDLEKQTTNSKIREIAKRHLSYKGINMKTILAGWEQDHHIWLICQAKNHNLFVFGLNYKYQITLKFTNEELLGAHIEKAVFRNNFILVKDADKWKILKFKSNNDFMPILGIHCEKAFLSKNGDIIFYLKDQHLHREDLKHQQKLSVELKYANPELVEYLDDENGCGYFLLGIKLYKLSCEGVMTASGFAIKNEKARLDSVCIWTKSLIFRLNDQFVLLDYSVNQGKLVCRTRKSHSTKCVALQNGMWAELETNSITIGLFDKILTIFPLSNIYSILEVENKSFAYELNCLVGKGYVLIIKNYAFFLQLVQNESGYELLILKKNNKILYKRFNPHASQIQLLDPHQLVFLVDNTLIKLSYKLQPNCFQDPFTLPDTLIKVQLALKDQYSFYHPKSILSFISCNKFELVIQIFKKLKPWLMKQNKNMPEIYELLNLDFLREYFVHQIDTHISEEKSVIVISPKQMQENLQFLLDLSDFLNDQPNSLMLEKSACSLVVNEMKGLAFYYENYKSLDFFAQSAMVQVKTLEKKDCYFQSMHVAFLNHSLNKEEVLGFIKPEKVDWAWIQRYSIILWYDNKEVIKKWIEEIAINEFRNKKDPFDCLFWYILVNKKSLLITLFKNQKFDSKEHDAMHTFLMRDFSLPKDKTAAVKNAYVLLDKKRYFHAMAFFILGDKLEECIRLSLDRLKDMNLAYLVCIIYSSKDNKIHEFLTAQILEKGDVWMNHWAHKIQSHHIDSHNELYSEDCKETWEYVPKLTGFHPAIIDFSSNIYNSIPVKRQLEEQKVPITKSQDIFSSDYEPGEETISSSVLQIAKKQIYVNHQWHQEESIKYFLRNSLPGIALLLSAESLEAKKAFQLEQYKLAGMISESVEETVINLEDTIAMTGHYLKHFKNDQLVSYVQLFLEGLKTAIKAVGFEPYLKVKKAQIAEVVHYCYFADQLIAKIKAQFIYDGDEHAKCIEEGLILLKTLGGVGKVYLCLLLNSYDELLDLITCLTNKSKEFELNEGQFWKKIRQKYSCTEEDRKSKQSKLMDNFQHAFIDIKRRTSVSMINSGRNQLSLLPEETCLAIFQFIILSFLHDQIGHFTDTLKLNKNKLQISLQRWVSPEILIQVQKEFKSLIHDGSQSKLKVKLLESIFGQNLTLLYDIVILCDCEYTKNIKNMIVQPSEQAKNAMAIQIFKSKSQNIRFFSFSKNEGSGLDCVVLTKRGLRRIDLCESLMRRERTKDYLGLILEDSLQNERMDESQIDLDKYPQPLNSAVRRILEAKAKMKNSCLLRAVSRIHSNQYTKPLEEIPALNYSQLNALESHHHLPILLSGYKGNIEVFDSTTLTNFQRIKCNLSEIIKIQSSGHRITALDTAGSIQTITIDMNFSSNTPFTLKKAAVIDFCHLCPSIIAVLTNNSLQVYDTLLHPNRQIIFKQAFTNQPLGLAKVSQSKVAVVRKNQVLVYDIKGQKLHCAKDLKGKGKAIIALENWIYVGLHNAKILVFNLDKPDDHILMSTCTSSDERDREKVTIEGFSCYEGIVLAASSEGSLFYLPPVQ